MKKLLLSAALLFTFAFTHANEDISKKESTIPTENGKGASQTSVEKAFSPSVKEDPAFECFGLSCGTVCGTWSGSPTPEEVVAVWEQLEEDFCG